MELEGDSTILVTRSQMGKVKELTAIFLFQRRKYLKYTSIDSHNYYNHLVDKLDRFYEG
jgi:hypothetical protein